MQYIRTRTSIKTFALSGLLAALFLFGCKTRQPMVKTPAGCDKPVVSTIPYFINEHLVMATIWLQQSAEYRALAHQAWNIGKMRLDDILPRTRFAKPPCVVVDIDETVLNNSPYTGFQIRCGQPFSPKTWAEWVVKQDAEPIPGAVEFLKYAGTKGVETFYISNRDSIFVDKETGDTTNLFKPTMKNLAAHGFPNVDAKHILLKTTTSAKDARRARVEQTNTIVLRFGDALGDMSEIWDGGNSAQRRTKVDQEKGHFGMDYICLPNPTYGPWQKALRDGAKYDNQQKDSLRHAKIKSF